MKGSGIIIAVIIGIIIIGVILGFMGNPSENKVVTLNENVTVQNKQVNNTEKNNVQNNQTENLTSENTETAEQNIQTTTEEKNEETPKTDTEKAIDIVKLDLGSMAENANITVDSVTNDGKFVISVREKDTTQALAFYTVNVNDKTFTKKEMY